MFGRNRIGYRKAALALAVVLGLTPMGTTLASSLQDAQEGLKGAQEDINRIEGEQNALRQEMDSAKAQLVDVILNLSILENDLEAKQEKLVQVQADLVQAQEGERSQYEAMKKRIRFMYEQGDKALLTTLLESSNIVDLLNRVEYFNQIYDYDRNLLDTYQATVQQVADLEVQVQSEIAELENMRLDYQAEQQRYETMIAQLEAEMDDFDSMLAEAKSLAAAYQNTIAQENERIRKEEEARRAAEEAAAAKAAEEEARKNALANNANGTGSNNDNKDNNSNAADNGSSGSGTDNNNNNDNSTAGSGGSGGDSDNGSSAAGNGDSGGDQNPGYTTGVSGSAVVDYACQFIGNPYVYGGTDINNGIDCSAFTQYVFAHFGISLPRTSYEQRYCGKEVSYSNAQPGDLVCYAGHVGIYMGGGQVVHASNSAPYPAGGIKISSATHMTILSVRRVL